MSRQAQNSRAGLTIPRLSRALFPGVLALVAFLTACSGGISNQAPSAAPSSSGTASAKAFTLTEAVSQSAGSDKVETAAYSPDGQRLAVGLADGAVAVFSLADPSGDPVLAKLHGGADSSLAWSPDGTKLLSAATDGSVRLTDSSSLQVLRSFNAYPATYPSVAWAPDGHQFALAEGRDVVRVYDADSGALLTSFDKPGATTRAVLWLAGGDIAVSDTSGAIDFFRTGQTKALRTFRPTPTHKAVNSLSAAPDGVTLAAAYDDGAVLLLDASTAKVIKEFPPGRETGTLAWSPSGKALAVTSVAFDVRVFDAQGSLLAQQALGYDVNGVAWSPDGQHLMAGVDDHTFRIWDVTPPQAPVSPNPQSAPSYMGR